MIQEPCWPNCRIMDICSTTRGKERLALAGAAGVEGALPALLPMTDQNSHSNYLFPATLTPAAPSHPPTSYVAPLHLLPTPLTPSHTCIMPDSSASLRCRSVWPLKPSWCENVWGRAGQHRAWNIEVNMEVHKGLVCKQCIVVSVREQVSL